MEAGMQLLRYIVHQLSPWGIPLRSDTLCGLVLTRLSERQGPQACLDAIDAFRSGQPPFILSSLMPSDTVFMPTLPPPPRELFRTWVNEGAFSDENGKKLSLFSACERYKSFSKIRYIPLDLWLRHRNNLSVKPLFEWFCSKKHTDEPSETVAISPHVTIDRAKGTAHPNAFFFNSMRYYAKDMAFHIYARSEEPAKLLEILQEVGDFGFGQDASTGKGRFSVEQDTSFDASILDNSEPHSLLCSVFSAPSLANCDGWYTIEAKRGKAGPLVRSPYKATLLLMQEGSVLLSLPQPPFILEGINADKRIVQITHPFVLSCRLTEEVTNA